MLSQQRVVGVAYVPLRPLSIKAAFHYSSQLQTWFSTKFAARFLTSSCVFATCFRPAFDFFVENLAANLLHQSRHVEIDAAGSQQVCWFVCVLDKWNVQKTVFSKFAAGFRPHSIILLLSERTPWSVAVSTICRRSSRVVAFL